jgi:hypothetical protein
MPSATTTSVKDQIRAFNKHVLNPAMMHLAGRKYWYASVIRHVGRRSGRHYATPVVADQVADGFIIPLPYGTHVDWLRNVQTSGQAIITAHGRDYDVAEPELLDAVAVTALLPGSRVRAFTRFGVEQFLLLRAAR